MELHKNTSIYKSKRRDMLEHLCLNNSEMAMYKRSIVENRIQIYFYSNTYSSNFILNNYPRVFSQGEIFIKVITDYNLSPRKQLILFA